MKSEKYKQSQINGTLWLRVPAALMGLAFIVLFPIMAWQGHASAASAFSGVFIGIIFAVYGLGGSKRLHKVLPSSVKKL